MRHQQVTPSKKPQTPVSVASWRKLALHSKPARRNEKSPLDHHLPPLISPSTKLTACSRLTTSMALALCR